MFDAHCLRHIRRQQADLNLAFVELVLELDGAAPGAKGRILGLDQLVVRRLARVRHTKRATIADCLYALYDLRLDDARFWSQVRPRHIPDVYAVAALPAEPELRERLMLFQLTVLLNAWHLAGSDRYAPQIVLGLSRECMRALRRIPVTTLPRLARLAPGLLSARLSRNRRFWPDLVQSVDGGSRQQRQAAKACGLHLIVAQSASIHSR